MKLHKLLHIITFAFFVTALSSCGGPTAIEQSDLEATIRLQREMCDLLDTLTVKTAGAAKPELDELLRRLQESNMKANLISQKKRTKFYENNKHSIDELKNRKAELTRRVLVGELPDAMLTYILSH